MRAEIRMDRIVIKQYECEDREGCIDLLRRTFPGTSDEETFKWRFETSNRRKPPLLIVAKNNGKVISFNSWLPWDFSYRDKQIVGYQSGESATDINYRGRGIFTKILRYADQIASKMQVDFFFGYPSRMSYAAFFKGGYYPVAANSFCIRTINPFWKTVGGSFEIHPDYAFTSMLKEEGKITPIFNYDYCNWRYLENPKHFEIIEFSEHNCVAIFFLRRKQWKIFNELILLDSQFNNYNDKFIKKSIRYLDTISSGKATYMRTFFNKYTDRGRALARYFRIHAKWKYYIFIVKPVSENIDRNTLLNWNCWDYMPHCVDEL